MRPPSRTENFTDWEATTRGLRWYVCWRLFSRSARVRCPSTSCWESRPRRSAWAKTASAPCCPPWGKWTWRWWANRRGCRPQQANEDWSSWTARRTAGAVTRRGEGVNALYIALDDIARLRSFRFGRESELLGPIGIAVTQIEAGTQHNVVPDTCRFVVDVRTTDAYSNEETVGILRAALRSEAVPRSTRIRAAAVGGEHPLVKAAVAAGRETYVSPTTSDRTLMPFPALKMGPGQSSRSHTADEFVLLEEIAEGIAVYEKYIGKLAQEYGWKTLG